MAEHIETRKLHRDFGRKRQATIKPLFQMKLAFIKWHFYSFRFWQSYKFYETVFFFFFFFDFIETMTNRFFRLFFLLCWILERVVCCLFCIFVRWQLKNEASEKEKRIRGIFLKIIKKRKDLKMFYKTKDSKLLLYAWLLWSGCLVRLEIYPKPIKSLLTHNGISR